MTLSAGVWALAPKRRIQFPIKGADLGCRFNPCPTCGKATNSDVSLTSMLLAVSCFLLSTSSKKKQNQQ